MTMLNAAPTAATAAPTGPAATPTAQPAHAALPAGRATTAAEPTASGPRLLGTGATSATPAGVDPQGAVIVPLDAFAKRSGPDASVKTADGIVNVHAIFQLDAKTRQVSVAIVNQDGELVRMIPPESVSKMIAAMATYRGR